MALIAGLSVRNALMRFWAYVVGSAVVLVEAGLTSQRFMETVTELIGDDVRLNTMAEAMKNAAPADATERITDVVLSLAMK